MITEDQVEQMITKAVAQLISKHTDFVPPVWMNTKQVSEYTGIATRTLEEYRRKLLGPRWAKRHGNVRYNRGDVDRWLMEAANALYV